jgi:hypothetical protein
MIGELEVESEDPFPSNRELDSLSEAAVVLLECRRKNGFAADKSRFIPVYSYLVALYKFPEPLVFKARGSA